MSQHFSYYLNLPNQLSIQIIERTSVSRYLTWQQPTLVDLPTESCIVFIKLNHHFDYFGIHRVFMLFVIYSQLLPMARRNIFTS